MNPQFVYPQHHNDFAHWAYHQLHDRVLAEKLSIIDPMEFDSLEELRQEVIEIIEARLDENEPIWCTRKGEQFYFVRSIVVVFDRTGQINHPNELLKVVENLSCGEIFYHFIDARMRTSEKTDDFSLWLKGFGDRYNVLIESIQSIDPYFLSLTQLKEELIKAVKRDFPQGEA